MMNVSRSGFYKWRSITRHHYRIRREELIEDVKRVHEAHKTHGYRWIANYLRLNKGWQVSDGMVYKCWHYLGLKCESRHQPKKRKKAKKSNKNVAPNLIYSTWDTVDRPRQVIVSDMTAFSFNGMYFELTPFFDVFTYEPLTYRVAERRGSRSQYIDGLEDVRKQLIDEPFPVIIHTDQGPVYTSNEFNKLFEPGSKFKRSMSRVGTPGDNPVHEALNSRIKEELETDFGIKQCRNRQEFLDVIAKYFDYFKNERPCWAIGYNIPAQYKKMYDDGLLERKDTFEHRLLSEIPKSVQKKKKKAETQKNDHS